MLCLRDMYVCAHFSEFVRKYQKWVYDSRVEGYTMRVISLVYEYK